MFFPPALLRVGGRGVEGPAFYRPDVTLDRLTMLTPGLKPRETRAPGAWRRRYFDICSFSTAPDNSSSNSSRDVPQNVTALRSSSDPPW
jgi:hypothetical protein